VAVITLDNKIEMMNRTFKLPCAFVGTVFLAACQTPEMARTATNYELCEQVYVYGNQKYYADELSRRRINCNQYSAQLQREANKPGFFDSIAGGIAGAQKFQQPPPGFVYIPPGTSRSNYMTCNPDGRGGYYCK
jgi:hypothetical protein